MRAKTKKVALVTGASSGIGRATALELNAAGYRTYASARHPEKMADLQAYGLKTIQLDVTDEDSMVSAIQAIEIASGSVDVLVNNAGYSELGPVEEVSLERVRRQFETNVFGLIRLTQLVLPEMRRKGWGRIINISSMGGEFTSPYSGIYHASKYAVEAISDALRFEVQPFGVDVIVIQPGVVQTALGQASRDTIRASADSPYADQLTRYRHFVEANADPNDPAVLLPGDVSKVILQAVDAKQPETRYKVGPEAEQLPAIRRRLSDHEWDDMYRKCFGS